MKKIGIVGGVAWPSTIEYYRLICIGANAHFRDRGHGHPLPAPRIAIESVNMAETRALRGKPGDDVSWAGFDAVFRDCFRRLHASGCDFGLIASNTPHARLPAIRQGLDLPLLSILDETARAAAGLGVRHALVLGTSVTMEGGHYPQVLGDHGLMPNDPFQADQIAELQALIDTDFHEGATSHGRDRLLEICERHTAKPRDTVILLACTELPLAFPDNLDDPVFEAEGFTFVNTTAAHARAALKRALED